MTFEWEDITDELLEKVVCFSFDRSSGLGGPGSLIAITENGQEYFIGLYCTWVKENEILNRFLGDSPITSYSELERTREIGFVTICFKKIIAEIFQLTMHLYRVRVFGVFIEIHNHNPIRRFF